MLLSRYIINKSGSVFDKKRNRYQKLHKNTDGYLCCTLTLDNNKRKTFKVHRLVAFYHVEEFKEGLEVNHKDGNKENNNSWNLEWVTHSKNIQHAWDNGLLIDNGERKKAIREKQGKPIKCVTTGEIFNSLGEACEKYNIKKSNLSAVCLKKKGYKTAKNLKWEYYGK